MMNHGWIIEGAIGPLDDRVRNASKLLDSLPERYRSLDPVGEVPVVMSDFLKALRRDTLERVSRG